MVAVERFFVALERSAGGPSNQQCGFRGRFDCGGSLFFRSSSPRLPRALSYSRGSAKSDFISSLPGGDGWRAKALSCPE
jgi:hypothetical protein